MLPSRLQLLDGCVLDADAAHEHLARVLAQPAPVVLTLPGVRGNLGKIPLIGTIQP